MCRSGPGRQAADGLYRCQGLTTDGRPWFVHEISVSSAAADATTASGSGSRTGSEAPSTTSATTSAAGVSAQRSQHAAKRAKRQAQKAKRRMRKAAKHFLDRLKSRSIDEVHAESDTDKDGLLSVSEFVAALSFFHASH